MSEVLQNQSPALAETNPDDRSFRYDRLTVAEIERIARTTLMNIDALAEYMVTQPELTFDGTLAILNEIDSLYASTEEIIMMKDLHPETALREAATSAYTSIQDHSTDFAKRDDIYRVVKAYATTNEAQNLTDEQARLLTFTLRDFRQNGLDLAPQEREKLAAIQKLTDKKVTEFCQNIKADNTAIALTKDELSGVPDSIIAKLKNVDDDNLLVPLTTNNFWPDILKYATDRQTRRRITVTLRSRLMDVNPPIMTEIVGLRQEMAELLGYPTWADFKLETRMTKTPQTVRDLYANITDPLTEKANQEIAVMTDLLRADGYDGPLASHDTSFYTDKLCQTDYNVDAEKVSEYLPLERVVSGFFEIAEETFGIKIRPLSDQPVWCEGVTAYAIDDAETGEQISLFYLDLYTREGKYKGAAAATLKTGREMPDGSRSIPSSLVMANFSDGVDGMPTLLQHREAVTLFHELGHILHQTLTTAKYVRFAGTHTERDFVEAPSQIQENWMWDPQILARITRHYKTGEPMPPELIENMIAARYLNAAVGELAQITLGTFDMSIHNGPLTKSVEELWRDANTISPLAFTEGSFHPATITHFMKGYDAGYYTYIWSRTFGDDAYSLFLEYGATNPIVGRKWRHLLEQGGTEDAYTLMCEFLGREPNTEAFERSMGIAA